MRDWTQDVVKLLGAKTHSLRELAELVGGDPKTFYRHTYFKARDLKDQDMTGMEYLSDDDIPLPPIPYVDPEVQERAEREAAEMLKNAKPIPPEIGEHVRVIGEGDRPIQISEFSLLDNCIFVQEVWLERSPAIDFESLAKLKYLDTLDLDATGIEDLSPLSNLNKLKCLYLNRTKVRDLTPLVRLQELSALFLHYTPIDDLTGLETVSELNELYISHTKVIDLSPLSNLLNLGVLVLGHTGVTDLGPLGNLRKLRTVHAYGVNVEDWSPIDHVETVFRDEDTGE